MHYMVNTGDTLWQIAQRFRMDADTIARANSMSEPYSVYAGQILHIPRRHRLIGYIVPHAAAAGIADALSAPEPFDEVIFTAVTVNPDGSATSGPVDVTLQLARARRTRALANVTNLHKGTYSTEAADNALLDGDARSRLASVATDCAVSNHLDGVHLEFGAINEKHLDAISELACEIRARFSRLSPWYTISISVPSGWREGPFDLARAAQCADMLVVEGFQRGSYGPPGPPTDLAWLEQQASYALEDVGRTKLCVALGAYGLDWGDYDRAGFLTVEGAQAIAANTGSNVQRDPAHGGPFFQYIDTIGRSHSVWYEDAASILLKLSLLDSLGVRRVGLWRLGNMCKEILSVVSQAVV
jgi:spore germination protein